MKKSANNVNLIRPGIFGGVENIDAFFTLRNEKAVVGKGLIPGLNLGFNTGEAAPVVEANRSMLLSQAGISPDWIAYADQVHGTRVRVATDGGTYPETDGLVTRIPELALAIQVADCAAVLMGDPQAGIIAAVHAGWRGAAGGILSNAVDTMVRLGGSPGNIRVFISPCISLRNFEVGTEVAEQFPDEYVDYEHYRKPHVDLKGFLVRNMTDKGIEKENIEVHEGCTVEEGDKYYSHRREQERSGRMMGVIRIVSPAV